jgi:hypothetical protein
LWSQSLDSSGLLEYEVLNRVHARATESLRTENARHFVNHKLALSGFLPALSSRFRSLCVRSTRSSPCRRQACRSLRPAISRRASYHYPSPKSHQLRDAVTFLGYERSSFFARDGRAQTFSQE